MKASDVLSGLAELLAFIGRGAQSQEPEQDNDGTDPGVFVPPLQTKIEILKKSAGLDNVYDEHQPDELNRIKQIAGLTPAQQIAADDDEPFDG